MPPKSKKQHPKPKSQPPDHPKPNWPPLRPLIPSSNLSLESLLHDQIYLIRNFLPSSLCKTYAFFLASLPLTTTPSKPKKGEAVRVNDRFQIQDADFAERLWSGTALRELVSGAVDEDQDGDGQPRSNREIWGGEPLGLNANIRQARTTWTLLVYLTNCTGGETVFYPEPTGANRNPEPIAVAPEVGMALLHRHGERCLLHEGREVTEGEKWVLRSDLVVAR
ncbi:hypothetical protein KXW40_006243 [Aspergillus fumigatus]|nr:hypothetical protein KXX26_007852 [Aspergillus fumigatus]KAH1518404.1 hypothetical protein KXX29_007487 [Aspergillus fumigatus]KAH2527377.1 hypothetical protein KXW40_006243 [Aspergillus fumigatus]KAH3615014.1 hypothetical protein KXV38_005302 [Aspergillus fumigatus]